MSLAKIGDHAIISIAQFLDLSSLLTLRGTSKKFASVFKQEAPWIDQLQNFIQKDLIQSLPFNSELNAFESFKIIYQLYRRIMGYFTKLLTEFQYHNPRDLLTSNYFDSKLKKQLAINIDQTFKQIPLDYYIAYRLLNGQDAIPQFLNGNSLLGGYHYYGKYVEFKYLGLEAPSKDKQSSPNSSILNENQFGFLGEVLACPAIKLCIDHHNAFGMGQGAVFSIIGKSIERQTGQILHSIMIFSNNLTHFLHNLSYCKYSERTQIIEHFDTQVQPQADVTTAGIRVRNDCVLSPFDGQYSGKRLFAYQLRVSANGVKGRWKLTTRHWIIRDANKEENVKGPGVIGEYPEIYEGCEDFVYESCCPQSGFNGSMEGFLHFENMETQEEVEVVVGKLYFRLPKGSALLDYDFSKNEVVRVIENRTNEHRYVQE